MVKKQSPGDIKKIFGIEGKTFTDEEKAQALADQPWLKEHTGDLPGHPTPTFMVE